MTLDAYCCRLLKAREEGDEVSTPGSISRNSTGERKPLLPPFLPMLHAPAPASSSPARPSQLLLPLDKCSLFGPVVPGID